MSSEPRLAAVPLAAPAFPLSSSYGVVVWVPGRHWFSPLLLMLLGGRYRSLVIMNAPVRRWCFPIVVGPAHASLVHSGVLVVSAW
jgi:hypothetical protein